MTLKYFIKSYINMDPQIYLKIVETLTKQSITPKISRSTMNLIKKSIFTLVEIKRSRNQANSSSRLHTLCKST